MKWVLRKQEEKKRKSVKVRKKSGQKTEGGEKETVSQNPRDSSGARIRGDSKS